jgi:hypothetical protein
MHQDPKLTPEERQSLLEQAPKLVQYGIDKGWIKPQKEEKPAWYQKTNQPHALP